MSGNQTTTSGEIVLGTPVNSITETIAGSLIAGASGNASIDGFAVYLKLAPVPEPGSLALVALGLLGVAGWRRARD